MIHRLPTKIHLWARLHTDAAINEGIPLNRAELCDSAVFLHSQSSLMVHRLPTNCRQKLFHSWAKLHTDATINEVISLNRTELFESVVFLHSQSILTMHMNDS